LHSTRRRRSKGQELRCQAGSFDGAQRPHRMRLRNGARSASSARYQRSMKCLRDTPYCLRPKKHSNRQSGSPRSIGLTQIGAEVYAFAVSSRKQLPFATAVMRRNIPKT
jgi:hypothetical protein